MQEFFTFQKNNLLKTPLYFKKVKLRVNYNMKNLLKIEKLKKSIKKYI